MAHRVILRISFFFSKWHDMMKYAHTFEQSNCIHTVNDLYLSFDRTTRSRGKSRSKFTIACLCKSIEKEKKSFYFFFSIPFCVYFYRFRSTIFHFDTNSITFFFIGKVVYDCGDEINVTETEYWSWKSFFFLWNRKFTKSLGEEKKLCFWQWSPLARKRTSEFERKLIWKVKT